MSWCDKLASTPAVGFKLDHHIASSAVILDALSPVMDKWILGDKPLFRIEKQDAFILEFSTEDGFSYGVDPTRVHVTFNHMLRAKSVSAGPPVMEMLSRPRPFTELLPEVSRRLAEVLLLLPGPKNRTVTRVGVITNSMIADDELPPGLARFIDYVGRPWSGAIKGLSCQIISEIEKTPRGLDRCIHTLNKPEDPEQLINLKFDWQRIFASGRPITPDSIKEALVGAQKDSIEYFEDLAEGNRFDESLIGNTA